MPVEFRPVRDEDIAQLTQLWDTCDLSRPWNPADQDIAALRAHPCATLLVADLDGKLGASVAAGYDGHRGWVYYVGTTSAHRGQGIGTAALKAAEDWLQSNDVPKIMLMVRDRNETAKQFYESLGYTDAGVRVMQKWLSGERQRLFEENRDEH